MNMRRPTSRWALWVFAAALLLKSAMPWLASASAQMQGKALVEVCTVYGVSLVPLGIDAPADHAPASSPDHSPEHGAEHCALSALALLGATAPPPALPGLRVPHDAPARAPPAAFTRDACASWVARLKHGPPAFA